MTADRFFEGDGARPDPLLSSDENELATGSTPPPADTGPAGESGKATSGDTSQAGRRSRKPNGNRAGSLPVRRGLSDNELAIMTILWREGETTGRVVSEQFPHTVAYTTILTYLKRLEGKGFVGTTRAGRAHRFSARISREEIATDCLTRTLYALDSEFAGLLRFAVREGRVPGTLAEQIAELLAERNDNG